MVNEISKNNFFLINAPAGSGKTTIIKNKINYLISTNKKINILAITYTNRAAKELMDGIKGEKVDIKTIHSFMASFMKQYFNNNSVLNFFFETYEDMILKNISKYEENEIYLESKKKYIEKYGDFNYETVKNNIKEIAYNETEYSNFIYGTLGHDDLLGFSEKLMCKFPIIKKRLSSKYKYVFIDEYQDTAASVLNFFYESLKDTNSKLYLFGDRMQQIYKNYDGSFEEKFNCFNTEEKLRTNYRSSKEIIYLLNNIYNNEEFNQIAYNDKSEFLDKPKVIISNDFQRELSNLNENYLKLYIVNKKRFNEAGVKKLYEAVEKIGEYGYGRRYNVVDVLTKDREENPNIIFRLLITINKIIEYYESNNYGTIIQLIKYNDYDEFFSNKFLIIRSHKDKFIIKKNLKNITQEYKKNQTIQDYIINIAKEGIFNETNLNSILQNEKYKEILAVNMIEVRSLFAYLNEPYISTQHGVKGEGYDKVCFIAEDNAKLGVKIYDLFNLWTSVDIEFNDFQKFYYCFKKEINLMLKKLELSLKPNKNEFESKKEIIVEMVSEINQIFIYNQYYIALKKESFEKFLKAKNVTSLKEYLKYSSIEYIINAYKIFYVGCSRAKKSLKVLVDNGKISKYKVDIINKFEKLGFEVNDIS